MKCIAEGVEDMAQLQFLHAIGCEYFQGYLLARPMPVEAFLAWDAKRAGPVGLSRSA